MPRMLTHKFRSLILPIALATLFVVTESRADSPSSPLDVTITIDANVNRHPISPLIYGVSFGTTQTLKDLRAPINRSGGNSASAYNWRLNARHAGKDWFFQSLPVNPDDIYDQFGEEFVSLTQAANAQPMVTLSMIGRVAKLGKDRERLSSFSIAKYGAQQDNDAEGLADAGNGVLLNGDLLTNNDPDDASVTHGPQDELERVARLTQRFGKANAGGVRYYIMDNEPSLWHLTHRDIHPTGAHASEIANKVIAYSNVVKAVDPDALVVAPEEWGWFGYNYSGFDQQYSSVHGLDHTPDRTNQTDGMDYVPWMLTQWKRAGKPVDVFSLHFYPQSGEYSESEITDSTEVALARNRSTRNLWDPNYRDPTWINDVVALIPRMRQWVDTYYHPGTPIALTEYNWGGDTLMNGATAQADLLGIFGRERLDIATRWAAPAPDTPVYKAMKLYRNYDDQGGEFGSLSIAATTPDPDQVSAFAALREQDDAMTVMVINKQLQREADATLEILNYTPHGRVEVWQLRDNQLARLEDTSYTDSRLQATLPPQTVTLFVLHAQQ